MRINTDAGYQDRSCMVFRRLRKGILYTQRATQILRHLDLRALALTADSMLNVRREYFRDNSPYIPTETSLFSDASKSHNVPNFCR